ncbi:hypothetical protein CEQ90_11760 [Lewinellaceae bacterium SD302]|nr:hypothetical protein CEQ90_11760 [Lewinellaceae bacterium SD302]
MAKYLLAGEDINWLAIMALLTFFIVFSLSIFMVIKRGRNSYNDIARLPLEDGNGENLKSKE